jgi:hypothetical protein
MFTSIKYFVAGFVSVIPFVTLTDRNIKNYPQSAFVNDWKVIGYFIKKIILSKEKSNEHK